MSQRTKALKAMIVRTNLLKGPLKSMNIGHHFPVPQSFIKKVQDSRILTEWQDNWDSTDNDRDAIDAIPKISLDIY